MLGLRPALSGLGDGVRLPDLLRRILRGGRSGGRRGGGGDAGERSEPG